MGRIYPASGVPSDLVYNVAFPSCQERTTLTSQTQSNVPIRCSGRANKPYTERIGIKSVKLEAGCTVGHHAQHLPRLTVACCLSESSSVIVWFTPSSVLVKLLSVCEAVHGCRARLFRRFLSGRSCWGKTDVIPTSLQGPNRHKLTGGMAISEGLPQALSLDDPLLLLRGGRSPRHGGLFPGRCEPPR